MKIRSALLLAALTVSASIALADTPSLSDPDSLPKVSCTEFAYSPAFLKKYPKAPAACQEGRVLNGVKYAKFTAKVFLVTPEFTTVQLLNVSGDPTTTFSFKAPASATMLINGKSTKMSDLKTGDQISFWVPEKRLAAQSLPGPTHESWRVLPPQS